MSIYIHLEPPFEYLVTDTNGREKSRGQLDKLEDVSGIKARGPKIGVVPGQCINIRTVELPTNNKKKIASVLPNTLEEEVIEDIDSLFFRLIGPLNQKVKHTMVVGKEQLKLWLAESERAGIRLDKIIPDFALMPCHEMADYSLLFDEVGYAYIHEEYFYKKKIRQVFLDLWANSANRNSGVQISSALSDRSSSIACNDKVLLGQLGFATDMDVVSWFVGKSWVDWVGREHRSIAEFNLLEGEFTPRHKVEKYGGMKFALLVCLLAIFIRIGSDGYDYIGLINRDNQLDNQIIQLFSETFPEVERIVNPRVQLLNKISQIKNGSHGGDELLVILSLLSPITHSSNIELESMDYRNNELAFVCLLDNFSSLDHFHQRLKHVDRLDIALSSSGSLNGKISSRFVAKLK
ncbi:MAG: hypothetical protein GKR95_13010 [Gammaproteobacteria bacterium]|nr:hypothetical protein [Gammaproteobacteria bacterium]